MSAPRRSALLALAGISGALSDSCVGGPCVPGNEECSNAGFQDAPGFHLMDRSCGENDPNGPVFDPVHGIIHHFYQKHIATPPGSGPIYGHFVSRDFVHWARLPVAIWNGLDVSKNSATPYDEVAIYTGSATVMPGFAPDGVGDGIVQIYPGLCRKETWPACETGTLLSVALPANYKDDPLLINWTKPAYNPIVENTQRDPSTAWRTPHGEWRLRTFDQSEYGAASDAEARAGRWRRVGTADSLPLGECPSLYPLPGPARGAEAAYEALRAAGRLPTHVFKFSANSSDFVMVGTYDVGAPGQVGRAAATPGFEALFEPKKVDVGAYYASKDALYPPAAEAPNAPWRRVNWGWATVPPASTQTLPREVKFNPLLQQLEWAPLPEQDLLRTKSLLELKDLHLSPTAAFDLKLPPGSGRQSEVEVTFDLQGLGSGRYGVRVMAVAGQPDSGAHFFVDYSRPSHTGPWHSVNVSAAVHGGATLVDTLRLGADETALSIRAYVDNTFSEVYFQGGRVAITVTTPASSTADMSLTATQEVQVSARAWSVGSIWVSPEEVLRTPRLDRVQADSKVLAI